MSRKTVAVIDYGMGNLRSVEQAVRQVADARTRVIVTADSKAIAAADRVVFPGQGAARDCMVHLEIAGRREAVVQAFRNKPFLGICMGMEVLLSDSEENGGVDCLDLIPGRARHFRALLGDDTAHKIPHMGWNQVRQLGDRNEGQSGHALWSGIAQHERYYFCHSYYVELTDPRWVAGTSNYGAEFTVALAHENVFAVQFHPEKSATAGLQLLDNFIRWEPNQA